MSNLMLGRERMLELTGLHSVSGVPRKGLQVLVKSHIEIDPSKEHMFDLVD